MRDSVRAAVARAILREHSVAYRTDDDRTFAEEDYGDESGWVEVTDWTIEQFRCWLGY